MSDKHTLSIEYQIKQSRRCKNLSAQNRKLHNAFSVISLLIKYDHPKEKILKEIEKILEENKPL